MIDMNLIIASNIIDYQKRYNREQTDLVEAIGMTKQAVSKMLNGSRMINVIELRKIADYFGVGMNELTRIPKNSPEENVIHTLIDRITSENAKNALKIADELSDMILFHSRVRENGIAMMEALDEV